MDDNETDEGSNIVHIVPKKNLSKLSERVNKGNELTSKDKLIIFSVAIADGLDVETAYTRAYGEARPSIARKRGAKLAVSTKVRDLVKLERGKRQGRGLEEGDRLRHFLIDRLEYEAIHAKSDAARIASLRMIGELGHVQAFKPPLPGQIAELPSDMKEQIGDLMKRLGVGTSPTPNA